MRTITLLILVLLTSLTSAADIPPLPDNQPLDLILLIGQSNMAGRGTIEPQDQIPNPHIWKLDKDNHWLPSIDPLHFDKPKVAGVGLGSSFARELAAKTPDHYIGLIPAAVGGTSLAQWRPGSDLYNNALHRCQLAQSHGTLVAILWHQGESDCTASHVPTYLANLNVIITHLRTDLHSPDVPLIVGELGHFHQSHAPFTDALNAELRKVSTVIPHSACATAEDLTDRGDQTHFDSKSLRELGRRYAAQYFHLTTPTTQP
ncbi:MAG TPA: sialate O-acetylesterase [Tepidisphaeraceae bacterium]|jgi:pimeloyl-ACP methyl ester carboxylesterase|nr:sialate O-acetylesterase [Tepidisphaeraceae bacterium]